MNRFVRAGCVALGTALAALGAMVPFTLRDEAQIAYGDPAEDARFCAYVADDRVVGRTPCETLANPPVRTATNDTEEQ